MLVRTIKYIHESNAVEDETCPKVRGNDISGHARSGRRVRHGFAEILPWARMVARHLYLAVFEIEFSSVPVRYVYWIEAFCIGSQENKGLRQMRDISASSDGYSTTTRLSV